MTEFLLAVWGHETNFENWTTDTCKTTHVKQPNFVNEIWQNEKSIPTIILGALYHL